MEQYPPLQPTFIAVDCYLKSGNDYLLLKRAADRRHEPNKYVGVGGKVHSGENFVDTAVREIKEETGLTIAADKLRFRGTLVLEGYPERWIVMLFNAEAPSRDVVTDPREGTLEWVPSDEVTQKSVMEDIPLFFDKFRNSDDAIFGYCLFDDQNHIIKHSFSMTPVGLLQPQA